MIVVVVASLAWRLPCHSLRTRVPTMMGAAGTAAGGGGDISGGNDGERNAQLDQLRRMFEANEESGQSPGGPLQSMVDVKRLGLLLDLPLCRYSWCLLPHHQIAMSVWQPQYTLMFSTLLAQPPPHYYLHVLLPGGAESLGEPGFELEPDTKSALVGTLVRIVFARRNEDQTLTLVVQGLTRGVVLRPTQYLPYSRGDVQILPDSEALRAAARVSQRFLMRTGAGSAVASMFVRQRMAAAAAAAEASSWLAYEALQLSVDASGSLAPLNQLNASAAAECSADAPSEVQTALSEVMMPPSGPSGQLEDALYDGSVASQWLDEAIAHVTEAAEGWGASNRTDETERAGPGETGEVGAVRGPRDAGEVGDAGDAALDEAASEDEALLAQLEIQVWLELNELLALLGREVASVPVPTQLLGILPPPPAGGWPEDFVLSSVATTLADKYKTEVRTEADAAMGANEANAVRPRSYVPLDTRYPPRKRAERLSWAVWAVIGDQKVGVNSFGGSPYQVLLEADGTAERLRLARAKLREIKGRLEGADARE